MSTLPAQNPKPEASPGQSARPSDVLRLLKDCYTYPKGFVRMLGRDHAAAHLLQQVYFWSDIVRTRAKNPDPEGWFYRTTADWIKELDRGKAEILKAREKLLALGLIEKDVRRETRPNGTLGIGPKCHYRINLDAFETFLAEASRFDENRKNRFAGKRKNGSSGKRQNYMVMPETGKTYIEVVQMNTTDEYTPPEGAPPAAARSWEDDVFGPLGSDRSPSDCPAPGTPAAVESRPESGEPGATAPGADVDATPPAPVLEDRELLRAAVLEACEVEPESYSYAHFEKELKHWREKQLLTVAEVVDLKTCYWPVQDFRGRRGESIPWKSFRNIVGDYRRWCRKDRPATYEPKRLGGREPFSPVTTAVRQGAQSIAKMLGSEVLAAMGVTDYGT